MIEEVSCKKRKSIKKMNKIKLFVKIWKQKGKLEKNEWNNKKK